MQRAIAEAIATHPPHPPTLPGAQPGSGGEGAGGLVDVELVDHALRLVSITCVSPEATGPVTAPLRKRFVEALLSRGLLKVMADIADCEVPYMRQVRQQRERGCCRAARWGGVQWQWSALWEGQCSACPQLVAP